MTKFFRVLYDFGFSRKYFLIALSVFLLKTDLSVKNFQESVQNELEWKYTNPEGAAIQNFRMTRSLEKGYPPSQLRFAAFDRATQILRDRKGSRTLQSSWIERGPVNVGGRTRAIMFDPNDVSNKKVWAGGVSGGIWLNNDITSSTSSWQQADDFMANLAVSSLAYDPLNPGIFYAGTGEGWQNIDALRGAGIFKSTDGGSSWTQLANTLNLHYVQKVVVTSQGTVLAAVKSLFSGGSGIYRSTDQGVSWNQISNINGPGTDIEIGTNGTILASVGIFSQGAIYKSTDDGLNWTSVPIPPNAERIEIAIAPSNPNIAYAAASNDTDAKWIAKSIDGGSSWTQLSVPTSISQNCQPSSEDFGGGQAWYDLILSVHPDDPDKVFLGGIDLYTSEDAGTTWEQISYWTGGCLAYVHADQHSLVFRPGNPDELLSGNDGGIFYSADISASSPQFSTRNKNYNVTQFYSLALKNETGSNYILGGTQDNGTHQFNNSGLNSTTEVTGGDGAFCFIDQDQPSIQITSYIGNQYFLSTNGGQSFGTISDDTDVGLFINPTEYDSYLGILYAAGAPGEIIRYSNLQSSPKTETLELLNGQVSTIKQSERVKGRIFVGTEGSGIYRIEQANTDNPVVFNISSGLSPNGYISSIATGVSDDNILITYSNYDAVNVYQTVDGGGTWVNKEGDLPNIPVRWVIYDPSDLNKALLASEVGLWSTTNLSSGSPTWVPDNEGLANVRCDMIQLRRSDGIAGVATHGRGVFTTSYVSLPVADIQITQPVTYLQQPVDFRNLSYNSGNSISWNFGDGSTSPVSNTSHVYDEFGVFDISLSVANGAVVKTVSDGLKVLPGLPASFLASDGSDFESNPDHFASLSLSGSPLTLGSSTFAGKNGTVSGNKAWVLDPANETYKPNTLVYLYTPDFNFINPGSYSLSFFTKFDLEPGYDGFYLEVSTDRGLKWTKLLNTLDPVNWYNNSAASDTRYFDNGEPIFSGSTNNSFVEKTADLTFLAQKEHVAFRFVFLSDENINNAGFAIDDFSITAPTTAQFTVDKDSICTGESVTYTNQSSGIISTFEWAFGAGALPSSATGAGPHEVVYSSNGNKDVSLTINGTSTESKKEFITVLALPSQIEANPASSVICFGEIAEITFSGLEADIVYHLLDSDSQEEILTFNATSSSLVISLDGLESDIVFQINAVNTKTGCASEMDVLPEVTVIPLPDPSITQNMGGTLTASQGDTFQWYFDSAPIPGAVAQTHDPDLKGSYTVEITENGCSAISDIFNVIIVGIAESIDNGLMVYPNPVNQFLSIETEMEINASLHLYLISTDGRIVFNKIINNEFPAKTVLDIGDIPAGVYILKLNSGTTSIERTIYKYDN